MKKKILLVVAIASLGVVAHAQTIERVPRFGAWPAGRDSINAILTAIEARFEAAEATTAAHVTVVEGANVVPTLHTPNHIGAVLITPEATNLVTVLSVNDASTNVYLLRKLVAIGVTTNDWRAELVNEVP